jgi:hypothetical protein
MRSFKLSTKRVVGLALATALAFSGTVAVAGSSEAAVAAVKPVPSTGATAGGTVVTITGKGFASAAGVSKVGTVWFELTTCAIANIAVNPVTAANLNVVSSTKITATTPALALTTAPAPTVYNMCVSNSGNTAVIGTAKFTSYARPTINTTALITSPNIGLSPIVGKSTGGGTVTIQGEHFTSKTTATVGGVPLTKVKVEIGATTTASATAGDDTLTGTLPAGTGAANAVVVTSEGGPSADSAVSFGYVDVVTVSPTLGNGTPANGITLTGSGFNARKVGGSGADFADVEAINTSVIVFKPVGALYTTATVPAGVTAPNCTAIQVVSDTELTCKAPDLDLPADVGGYQVMIIDFDGTDINSQTALTASSIYTVAPF